MLSSKAPNKISWNSAEQSAFDALKQALIDATNQPLSIIDWNKPFDIYTDASDIAIAGVLSQTDSQGNHRPISFFSKKLNDTQRKWSTIEREAFAVLESLNRFKSFVFGYEIHIYSDHNPLSYLTESAPKSAKLLRWSLALQNFNVCFHYKAGNSSAMAAPDCLSRLGTDDDD